MDLTTKSPSAVEDFLGIPGGRAGGTDHGKAPSPIRLPLEVILQDLWPRSSSGRDKFAAEILVRNVGKEPIAVPASRNYREVVKPGNQNQRMLTLSLRLTPVAPVAGNIKPTSLFLGLTVGSSGVPNSTINLAPGESLVIRVDNGSLFSDIDKWHDEGLNLVTARVKAVVSEAFLEDNEFTVRDRTEEATSRNSVDLTLNLTR